jgi:hypothetical protein
LVSFCASLCSSCIFHFVAMPSRKPNNAWQHWPMINKHNKLVQMEVLRWQRAWGQVCDEVILTKTVGLLLVVVVAVGRMSRWLVNFKYI